MNERVKRFEVKEEHLKLLREANVWWWDCEFGAPCIDPKRPYGNSSVTKDIADILGEKLIEDEYGEKIVAKEQGERFRKLHRQLEPVMEIMLHLAKLDPGWYECSEYGNDWRKVKMP